MQVIPGLKMRDIDGKGYIVEAAEDEDTGDGAEVVSIR